MIRKTLLDSGWEFAQSEWLEKQTLAYAKVPGWLPATVPGHVHLDLVANGIIEHPFKEMHELGCRWVDEADWSYRTTFEWHPDASRPFRVLKFAGLDTVCEVFLNGQRLSASDNMFLPLEVDVSAALVEGTNELRVDFKSAARIGRARQAAYFEKHGLGPTTANFEDRAFVRKAQYMFGWDWGPRLISCGIWQPVELLEFADGDRDSLAPPSAPVQIRLLREPDSFGESFEFEVNGKKLWARGANWIPDHSFSSQITREGLREKLEACKGMNFNMLRVWGGGLPESDDFYGLCDELGISVWQDFPYACSYYPDDPEHLEQARQEAIQIVKRLRHHSSLAIWCGNNEILTMWEGKWGGAENNPPRMHGETIWNEVLRDVVAEYDPGRPYIPTSPIGGPDANAGGVGDQHFWEVWHGKGDWKYYEDSTARFSSEFGFASSCGFDAWASVTDIKGLTPTSSVVRWHDKTGKPWKTFKGLVELHYPASESLEDWVYYSQLNQRDAMRHGIEHYRRSEFCKGSLIWQLNDCWPVQSWAVIDNSGTWKAAAYELRRLYADRMLSIERVGDSVRVYAVNDGEPTECQATLVVHSLVTGGHLREVRGEPVRLQTGERRLVLETAAAETGIVVVSAEGWTETWRLLAEPKNLKFGMAGPIRVHVEEGQLRLRFSGSVVDLMLWAPGLRMKENFVTALSGTELALAFEGSIKELRARSLAGQHPVHFD